MQQGEWRSAREQFQALLGSSLDKKVRKSLLGLYQKQSAAQPLRTLLQQSLQLYPQDSDFRLMDAGQLFAAKKYAELVKQYQLESAQKNIINLVAAAQQAEGNHIAAVESYQRSLKLDANQPRIQVSLAISLEQQRQFSQALAAYQSAQRSGALNARLRQFVAQRITQLGASG